MALYLGMPKIKGASGLMVGLALSVLLHACLVVLLIGVSHSSLPGVAEWGPFQSIRLVVGRSSGKKNGKEQSGQKDPSSSTQNQVSPVPQREFFSPRLAESRKPQVLATPTESKGHGQPTKLAQQSAESAKGAGANGAASADGKAQGRDATNSPGIGQQRWFQSPKILTLDHPQYTDLALDAQFEGTVRVRILVSESGRVRQVELEKSIGYGLDERIRRALLSARYQPALDRRQRPIAAWTTEVLRFTLD